MFLSPWHRCLYLCSSDCYSFGTISLNPSTLYQPGIHLLEEILLLFHWWRVESDIGFYASLHQEADEQVALSSPRQTTANHDAEDYPLGSCDLASGTEKKETVTEPVVTMHERMTHLKEQIYHVAETLKEVLASNEQQLISGVAIPHLFHCRLRDVHLSVSGISSAYIWLRRERSVNIDQMWIRAAWQAHFSAGHC